MNRVEKMIAFLLAWTPPAEVKQYEFSVDPIGETINVALTTCCLTLVLKVPDHATVLDMPDELAKFVVVLLETQAEKHREEMMDALRRQTFQGGGPSVN